MHSMEIDRRRFMALLGGLGASMAGMGTWAAQDALDGPLYLAARKSDAGFEATVIDEQGRVRRVLPLPARGHSFAIDVPRRRVIAFGRQPGFFAIAFSLDHGSEAPHAIQPPEGRHFFGHGVFARDGKRLFATENDYDAGRGVLGVYDASRGAAFRRVGEIDTGGIGPHEVILMPDGRTLCVANGGMLTHPDYGKLTLNAADMEPSLVYIDMDSGDIVEKHVLGRELHQLSIRHLVLDGNGAVWFGCQHAGPAQDRPALVGRHRRGASPELFPGPDDVLRGMNNYVGSLACDATGTRIATSSPVGGCVVIWDAASGRCLERIALFDGCGVAPARTKGFVLTSGQGAVAHVRADQTQADTVAQFSAVAWDNHLRRV